VLLVNSFLRLYKQIFKLKFTAKVFVSDGSPKVDLMVTGSRICHTKLILVLY